MKEKHIDEIKRSSGVEFLGCHRSSDGKCYYLSGTSISADYGDNLGFDAFGFREGRDGDLERGPRLRFRVSRSAAASSDLASLIGEQSAYLKRAAVAHLKAMLDRGEVDGARDIQLRSHDDASAFALPSAADPIVEQARVRDEVIRRLAYLHHEGTQTVTLPVLLDGMCTEVEWVHRALRNHAENGFVTGVERGYVTLTDKGHLEAERATTRAPQATPINSPAPPATRKYDCFVSYAGEDREMVRKLVAMLRTRSLGVWWDKGEITLGDKLTKKIEEGLGRSRYGLVIVSENFIDKHWPEAEIRALASRAI